MNVRPITVNALLAALYIVITIITTPFSYGGVQFRIAEALLIFIFFRKQYVIGIAIGCFIANIIGPMGWVDAVFGTLATLLSSIALMFSPYLLLALLAPVIMNGFIVGAELYFVLQLDFWINVGLVMIGEFVVLIATYALAMAFKKRKGLLKVIGANQNLDFKW